MNTLKKKKVMLIGGSGYIGNLIKKINDDDYEFKAFDIKKKSDNYLDITDANSVKRSIELFNPNIVINLAAKTDLKGKTIDDYSVNWVGVENLIHALNGKDIWLIHFSTMLVSKLGKNPRHDFDYFPDTLYGKSKVESEYLLRQSDINNWTIIRPTTVWGMSANFPYSLFIKIVKNVGFIELDIFATKRDFCHEDCAIKLMHKLLLNNNNEKVNKKVFYLTDKKQSSINKLARLSSEIYGGRTYVIPKFLNKAIVYTLIGLSKFGDVFEKVLGISFIMNTRRIKNMQTSSNLCKSMHDI